MITYNQIRCIHFQVCLDVLMWIQLLWKELKLFMWTSNIIVMFMYLILLCIYVPRRESTSTAAVTTEFLTTTIMPHLLSAVLSFPMPLLSNAMNNEKKGLLIWHRSLWCIHQSVITLILPCLYIYIFVLTCKIYWICGYLNVNKFI